MGKISLEYCHVTPGFDMSKEIKGTNERVPRILKMFENFEIQKCIMIDDIHTTKPADKEFVKSLSDQLKIKPDCIYLESSFIKEAHEMVGKINPKEIDFIYSNERMWLKESKEKYHSNKEFLLRWKNRDTTEFSCPALAATSYLFRLGHIKGDGVQPIYGKKVMISDKVLNVLSSQYLQVEANAQSIMSVTFKESLDKMFWFFY
ncbi:MAG: hypothetical protein V1768_01035 [Patescibacteria group bacterium]